MIRKKHSANSPSTSTDGQLSGSYPQEQETIAVALLELLAAQPKLLVTFLDCTGLRTDTLRSAARSGSLSPALLHHLLGDEQLLIEVARIVGRSAEAVAAIAAGQSTRN